MEKWILIYISLIYVLRCLITSKEEVFLRNWNFLRFYDNLHHRLYEGCLKCSQPFEHGKTRQKEISEKQTYLQEKPFHQASSVPRKWAIPWTEFTLWFDRLESPTCFSDLASSDISYSWSNNCIRQWNIFVGKKAITFLNIRNKLNNVVFFTTTL